MYNLDTNKKKNILQLEHKKRRSVMIVFFISIKI